MKRLRILTFLICLIPFVLLLLKVLQNDLGPDPAKELALETGGVGNSLSTTCLGHDAAPASLGAYGVCSAATNDRPVCPFLCERSFPRLGDFSTRPSMGGYP